MDLLQTIFSRRSIRNFQDKKVPMEVIANVIEAGFSAPVAHGKYNDCLISIVADKTNIANINAAIKKTSNIENGLYNAPVFVLISHRIDKNEPYNEYMNAATIIQNMMISATSVGLGSCIVLSPIKAIMSEPSLCAKLRIPITHIPVMACVFGYSKNDMKLEKGSVHEIPTEMISEDNFDKS